ncbi:MAG: FAD-dependent oxidoreductase [Hyphomicrobiales bacterium]|nr:FAD-dependent oxidoreductase [Hyphomicrobiales bacterium]
MKPPRVVVIGAGVVGACVAQALAAEGCAVTIVEEATPGGEQAASFGNGAWISPASIVPMSMPGLWRKVPAYLLDRKGPLTIRPAALPALAPWLLRFLAAGVTQARAAAIARALASLLRDAPHRHAGLAAETGAQDLIRRSGLLYVYADRAHFEDEALAWRLRADNGVGWRELDAGEVHARAPQLGARYEFGALVESGAHCRDPGGYVAAIVAHAISRGASLVCARATGFAISHGRLDAVETTGGPIAADRAVIAAGVRSATLARAVGDVIPLASERGYAVDIADPPFELAIPVMPGDGKMANTSLDRGLRIAGQVELAQVNAAPDWRRADILLARARIAYPALAESNGSKVARWMGHRPSTPDGKPVIGRASRCSDIIHAFGHGHIGLATAPATARIVADLLTEATPAIDPEPFSPRRF